tara:strand:- start:1548 stop:1700 length:153 start_codon:yes stop_codon:yes gene_type:complete
MNKVWLSIGYTSSAALFGMGIYNLIYHKELLPQIFLGVIIFLMVQRTKKL